MQDPFADAESLYAFMTQTTYFQTKPSQPIHALALELEAAGRVRRLKEVKGVVLWIPLALDGSDLFPAEVERLLAPPKEKTPETFGEEQWKRYLKGGDAG